MKINKNGKLIFLKYLVGAKNSLFFDIAPKQILLDKRNNIIISVDFMGRIDVNPSSDSTILKSFLPTYQDMAIVKFDNSGKHLWSFSLTSTTSTGSAFKSMKINSNDDIVINAYILGSFDVDPSSNNVIVNGKGKCLLYFNKNGQYINKMESNYSFKYAYDGNSLALDKNDNSISSSFGSNTSVIYKTDKNGILLWSGTMGSVLDKCEVRSIYTYPNGDFLMAGSFINLLDFDLTSDIDTTRSSSNLFEDYFIAKYNSNGGLLWLKTIPNRMFFEKSMIDNNVNLHLVGNIKGEATLSNKKLGSNNSNFNSFYAVFNTNGDLVHVDNLNMNCAFYGLNTNDFSQFTIYGQVSAINIDIDHTSNEYLLSSANNSYFTAVYGDNSTNISEIENSFIKIYPNPSNNIINIKIDHILETEIKIQILNSSGQVVYQNGVLTDFILDVKDWNEGVYFIKINNDSLNEVKSFIVFK